MTQPIDPYRSSHLCSLHAAAPPPCPRCAADWRSSPDAHPSSKVVGRIFIAGLFAATVFGAAIGTGIGFAAGASPFWLAGPPASSPRRHEGAAPRRSNPPARPRPAPPAVPASPVGRTRSAAVGSPVEALTPILARLGDAGSDPEALVARLHALAQSGVALTIETRLVSPEVRGALASEMSRPGPARVLPVERDGRVVGVRIFGVRPGSALARAGARNADVILAVNGSGMASEASRNERRRIHFAAASGRSGGAGGPPGGMDGRDEPHAWPFPGDARAAVVELERAGEHRVLVLRW